MNNLDKVYAENIAKEYLPKQTNKLRQLKKLDSKARTPAFVTSLTVGIIGTLIFGAGMSFGMGVLGSGTIAIVMAGVLSVIGIGICIINYPLYKRILARGKQKYTYEILELAKQISEENRA
ncbi:MAG: dihydropteridine reductase [Clostridiales bacterium]|nr:dihydropteridine reductase [Clostridiales bacterium]